MSQPFVGEIRMVGFNFPPNGWAKCDGQIIAITQNDALFQLIGTTYGGDGRTTFALPDFRSRLPFHMGNGFVIGETAGTETVTLTGNQIPIHNHTLTASNHPGTQNSPVGNVLAKNGTGTPVYSQPGNPVPMANAIQNSGGNQPHENMQPFLTINFVISLFGIFPSRN
jgi:microcystin-dependent protein